MSWTPKDSNTAVAEGPTIESPNVIVRQKPWTLTFKFANHAAEQVTILASTFAKAEEVGKKWCEKKGAGTMQGCRYVSVKDPIVADESILA